MNNLVLKMPRTESDRCDGINDGNIETYKNQLMLSLTKEELQNSADNAEIENGKRKKVFVEFHDFYIPSKDIPDLETIKRVFQEERDFWDEYLVTDKKAVEFFDNAISLLNKDKIRCMRISDSNTTGLTGITGKCSTPWKNLVKNRGVSDKDQSATGSFGIGKDAAFACSELRTVFYSTKNIDHTDNEAFQGVLKLPSYQKGNDNYDGIGFFSVASDDTSTNPLMSCISLDPSYHRTKNGMDKYILGFPETLDKDELKKEVIVSSINNFLVAFWQDKLVIKYDDIIVDKEHLDDIFATYGDSFDRLTIDYYETLKMPDETFSITVFEENDVTIYVKLMENANRRAAIVRQSGMKVFDKANISGRIEFAAVVNLTGDEANGFFKRLENPEHTGWAIDRSKDRKLATTKQNLIFDALRKFIQKLQQDNFSATIDSDGMSDYLPMTYVTGKSKKVEGLSNEVEKKTKGKKKSKKSNNPVKEKETITYETDEQGNIIESSIDIISGDDSGGSSSNAGDGGNSNGTGDGDGNGTGGIGGEKVPGEGATSEDTGIENENGKFISKRIIPNSDYKLVLVKSPSDYHLKAIGKKHIGSGFIEIKVSSESDPVLMQLSSASIDGTNAEISYNKIYFDELNENVTHDIRFDFKRPGNWAIEVTINEN